MNQQRKTYYGKRREVLAREDVHEEAVEVAEGVLVDIVDEFWPERGVPTDEQISGLAAALEKQFGVPVDPREAPLAGAADRDPLGRALLATLLGALEEKRKRCDALAEQHAEIGYPRFADYEREVLLRVGDRQWKDHLHAMDGLREGVSLRGYAQKDPKLEYQREGFALFEQMNARVDREVAEILFKLVLPEPEHLRPVPPPPPRPIAQPAASARAPAAQSSAQGALGLQRPGLPASASGARAGAAQAVAKVAPNEPCPCGSGKKYKKCHGV
jgi:preprotein translocase subunit SecA